VGTWKILGLSSSPILVEAAYALILNEINSVPGSDYNNIGTTRRRAKHRSELEHIKPP